MKPSLLTLSMLAISASFTSTQALAAGFQLNAQSATGIGRAFAGDAVIADNAAVMGRNPAAMALFDGVEVSSGFEVIATDIKVSNATYSDALGNQARTDYNDAGDTSFAPNIHLIIPVNEKFAWGVNAYSNFGTKTEFNESFVAREYGGVTDVKSANFGIAGSYRINDQVSVGGGLDLIYGEGTIVRQHATLGDLINIKDATGWGFGFNLGTVYELNEENRLGLAFRYSPEIEAKDDKGQKIILPLPNMIEFSGFHKIDNTKFAAHYSVQYTGWSDFDKLSFKNLSGSVIGTEYDKAYEWKDGMRYAIGGTYYMNDSITLRVGYMYDTSAQDAITSISVPDSDRQWLSAGFSYHLNKNSDIDFGLTYLIGQDVSVTESTPHPAIPGLDISSVSATTRANAVLFGLQYNYHF